MYDNYFIKLILQKVILLIPGHQDTDEMIVTYFQIDVLNYNSRHW